MCKLIMLTWKPGLNKIELNHELQSNANLSLSQAKQYIDDLLDGKNPVITLASREQADGLLRNVEALGVGGRIEC